MHPLKKKQIDLKLSRLEKIAEKEIETKLEREIKRFSQKEIDYIFENRKRVLSLIISLQQIINNFSGEMWVGRATVMINAYAESLYKLAEDCNLKITEEIFFNHLNLDSFISLSNSVKEKFKEKSKLEEYLLSLPGYFRKTNKLPQTCYEQHGYLILSFSEIRNEMEEHLNKKMLNQNTLKFETLKIKKALLEF